MGKCYNSATVGAPSDRVWNALKDFHEMPWATDVITKLEKVGTQDGSTPGAKRILNDLFHETLLSMDDNKMEFTYSIDDGPGPVAKDAVRNYVVTVTVRPVTNDNTAFVEWQSTYESSNDKAVGDFCDPVYQALLSALKAHF